MKTLAFVTGASRGLGAAIAAELLQRAGTSVVGISRSKHDSLGATSETSLEWKHADLSSIDGMTAAAAVAFAGRREEAWDRIVLFNNAGVVEPIAQLGTASAEDIVRNHHINGLAPLCLANAFIHAFQNSDARRVVINITSGLAQRPMAGVAAYCVSKAGLDMLTSCIAEEQKNRENPVEAYGSSPGTVATDMQQALRTSSPEALPDRDRFAGLYERGELFAPEFCARKTVEMLDMANLESGSVYRMSQL